MNKSLLLKQILEALEVLHQGAIDAAMLAYETATHEENVAENKYDTLGLEASYLAQGQARRVSECEADLTAFKRLAVTEFSQKMPINVGALIYLEDEQGNEQSLFLGPAAGGLKITCCHKDIVIITPTAPIGQALLGQHVEDEVIINVGGKDGRYEIVEVY